MEPLNDLGWKRLLKILQSNPQLLFISSLTEIFIPCSLYLLSLPFLNGILGYLQMLKHCQSRSMEMFLNHKNWLPAGLQGGVPSYMFILIHLVIIADWLGELFKTPKRTLCKCSKQFADLKGSRFNCLDWHLNCGMVVYNKKLRNIVNLGRFMSWVICLIWSKLV